MNKTVVSDMRNYVKNHYKLMIVSVVLVLVCYGYMALCGNLRIDTEVLINNPGSTMNWDTIGRFGLVFLKRILGLSTHHTIWSGMLFLMFFYLQMQLFLFLVYHFSKGNENYPYWVGALLYGTSNLWCFQVYFSLQQGEIACAMLLVMVAAALSIKAFFSVPRDSGMVDSEVISANGKAGKTIRTIVYALVSAVFMVIGFGGYQAFVAFYIAICICLFLVLLMERWESQTTAAGQEENRYVLFGIIKLLVHFVVVYVIYSFITKQWFTASDYLSSQKAWGNTPFFTCVKEILKVIKRAVFMEGVDNFSFYTIGGVLVIIALVVLCKKGIQKNKFQMAIYILALAGLAVTPFLLNVYTGGRTVTRSQFALPVVAAFCGMLALFQFKTWKTEWKWLISGGKLAVIAVTAIQIAMCFVLTYTDDVRNAQDIEKTETIVEYLKDANDGEMPETLIVFVGAQSPTLAKGCVRTEMFGWSFYEWDFNPANLTGATHRSVGLIRAYTGYDLKDKPSEEQKLRAVETAAELEDFPSENCVKILDDMVVVRLSAVE